MILRCKKLQLTISVKLVSAIHVYINLVHWWTPGATNHMWQTYCHNRPIYYSTAETSHTQMWPAA